MSDLRAAVDALASDLWRASPCGCGHRADLHTVGRCSGEPSVCVGGLGICGCDWSYTRIIQTRLRALLAAHPAPAVSAPQAVARGIRFRVETACDGYAALMEADVPESEDVDSYIRGAADAAFGIRAALAGEDGSAGGEET